MAQLAFQLQSKRIAGAADELLTALTPTHNQAKSNESQNMLSFAVRCLEFLTPRPKTVRSLTEIWVDNYLQVREINNSPINMKELFNASSYNYNIVVTTLEELFNEYFNMRSEAEALKIWDAISYFLHYHRPTDYEIYTISRNNVINSCTKRMIELSPKNPEICFDAVMLGIVNIADMIIWHGINSILSDRNLFRLGTGTICLYLVAVIRFLVPANELPDQDELLKVQSVSPIKLIYPLLHTRTDHRALSKIQFEMDKCGFSAEQQNFIQQWIRKKFSLVRRDVDKKA